MGTEKTIRALAIAMVALCLLIASAVPAGASPLQTSAGSGCAQFYTVRSGDNLYRIALRFAATVGALSDLNGITNPNRIHVGTSLCVRGKPPVPSGFWYTVNRGDTLYSIAGRYGVSVSYLKSVNHLPNHNYIVVGQKLLISHEA
jgi:LysM repeat protein